MHVNRKLTFKDTQLDVKGDKKENERTFDGKHVFFLQLLGHYILATGDIVT